MFEIVCGKCGATIYSGKDLRSAKDVLKVVGNRCRNCGATLSHQEFTLDVNPLPA